MIWPADRLGARLDPAVPSGYELRPYQPGDEAGFFKVMELAGFGVWTAESLKPWRLKILPDGWFLIVYRATGEIVATTMATHNPTDLHPFGGELGWVAGHPAHAGRGLGLATCTAATARFLRAGYRRIYLSTDDFRLPAIKTYLKLGYVPFPATDSDDHPARWQAVLEKLNWPQT
jgi:mycothiol synthase